jgi:carotenoid 1,2-hydratase
VDDDAIVFYDASDRAGAMRSLALQFTGGDIIQLDAPAMQGLPRTWWGMTRATRADDGAPIRIAAELESAPFYTRSILATRVAGQPARAFHESLSLDRVSAPWVRALLPFRMPRVR